MQPLTLLALLLPCLAAASPINRTARSLPSYWVPPAHPPIIWQWQLYSPPTVSALQAAQKSYNLSMVDIDLFDNSASKIQQIRALGVKVICYFSAGTYEKWRPDASQYPKSIIKQKVDGWPGENWLDVRGFAPGHVTSPLAPILQKRLALAKSKGCDGVEPDNVDGYSNDVPNVSAQDQLHFNTWLAQTGHSFGLTVGLKNDPDQVRDLVEHFDFSLNEECVKYSECKSYSPFIQAGKAVFPVQYASSSSASISSLQKQCKMPIALEMSGLVKTLDLTQWAFDCSLGKVVLP